MLYYAGLIESDAAKSTDLMAAALRSSVSAIHREKIYYLLAQYYLLKEDYTRLGSTVAEYLSLWETGRHRSEMQRFSVIVGEATGNEKSALRQAERYLAHFDDGDLEQWGLVDKARVLGGDNQGAAAGRLLERLSRKKKGPGVAIALYQLARQAIQARRIDDAVFYYNLLREGYPSAVGIDALSEMMCGLSSPDARDNTAEKITGTYYSVQVGVFSVKANAERLADDFKQYGHQVEIERKKISTNNYYVVLVGHFPDYESARAFKLQAERDRGETLQVIAR